MFQGTNLPGRVSGRWRLLPWVGFAVVALGMLVGYLGVIPGVWGQTALLAIFIASLLALRHDLLSAVVCVGLAIVEDWFQLVPLPHDLFYVALVGAMALLVVLFVSQRRERPWRDLRPLDLGFWGVFLLLGLLAVPRGINIPGNPKTIFFIALNYWIYIFLSASVFWLLGVMLVRRGADVRRLCVLLSALATALALHAILQELSGIFLFETPYWVHYLAQPFVNGYRLPGGPIRATTFFMAPDITESFFSSVVFLPLGLLAASRTWTARALYVGEVVAILVALLFTYGPVGWLAVAIGGLIFGLFTLRGRTRGAFLGGLVVAGVVGGVLLRREWQVLLSHATNPRELGLRAAIWRTALNVIRAHPLLGVGLGQGPVYELRAAIYKDASLPHMYPNPQNTFLEYAAFVGVPALLVFLCLLGRGLWGALKTYRSADTLLRPVILGAALVVLSLCVNGLSDITFTAAPLVPLVFVLLGALSSPRLARSLSGRDAGDNGASNNGASDHNALAPMPVAAPVRYGPPRSTEASPHSPEGPATQPRGSRDDDVIHHT